MADKSRPNILFVFSDQQRWDTLGCLGDTMGRALNVTPNLDAMAREGVLFRQAFTCQPVCGPVRSCLQTGLYATETGCWRNDIALPLDAVTLPRLLRPLGYDTGYVGKWHLASTGPDVNHQTRPVPPEYRGGYDDYWMAADTLELTSHGYDGHVFDRDGNRVEFPPGRYRVDALTDYGVEFLRRQNSSRPFFLFVSYLEPHQQNDRDVFEGPQGSRERFAEFPVPGDLEGTGGNWRTEMPGYLGCCAALDAAVGRYRDELEHLGLSENTLILYTSDHGCHFRTRNPEYKRTCQDSSVRIPMIMNGPGFQGGTVVDELVSLIDLPRTLVAAAGRDVPEFMRGHDLHRVASRDARDWRDEVFIQISESQVGRAIRTQSWKYSVRAPGAFDWQTGDAADLYQEDFLYDLHADPWERNNLVRDPAHATVRADLCERLKRRITEAGEEAPEIVPADT